MRMYINLFLLVVEDVNPLILLLSQLAVHNMRMYIVHEYLSPVGVHDMRLYI